MTTGKAVGVGLAGSVMVAAFGIPILAPLAILAALVTNSIVNRSNEEEHGNSEDSTASTETDNARTDNTRNDVSTSFRDYHLPEPLEFVPPTPTSPLTFFSDEHHPPWRNRRQDPLRNFRMPVFANTPDNEETLSNADINSPSLRNERYFQRHE